MSGQSAGKGGRGRTQWVDAAKGAGILFVIAGHVWWRPGPVHHYIYAFHMPLFFILSGYLVKSRPVLSLLVAQIRSLLVPFFAFCLLLIAADLLIEGMRGHRPIYPGFISGLRAILFRTEGLRGPFTVLWFVPCLFFARMAWNLIARFMPDPRDPGWAVLVMVVMAAAHWIAARTTASPMGLMAVPAAFTCYWIGQLWKARPPGPAAVLLALAPLAVVTFLWLPAVNMKPGDFGMPVLSLAGAAAISIILCLVLARLPEFLSAPMAWLGRASLVIMYVHVAFIHYLEPYMSRPLLFAAALVGSILIHLMAAATRPGRIVLMGE